MTVCILYIEITAVDTYSGSVQCQEVTECFCLNDHPHSVFILGDFIINCCLFYPLGENVKKTPHIPKNTKPKQTPKSPDEHKTNQPTKPISKTRKPTSGRNVLNQDFLQKINYADTHCI